MNATTSRLGELETFIDEATDGDESGRRREAMMRAISLPMAAPIDGTSHWRHGSIQAQRGVAGRRTNRDQRAEPKARYDGRGSKRDKTG